MTVFDTRALARPLFTDADFIATKWDGAAEKAAFANALCRFMSADFRESLFTQKLYRRLALSFGHIAHFERGCFYNHFFRDLQGKVAFLEETLAWVPCGHPSHTFCDVERAVLARLRKSNLFDAYHELRAAEVEGAERASLRSFARNMKARPRLHKRARQSCIWAPRRESPAVVSKANRQACSEAGATVPQ
jgi:hypothetical protein